MGQVCHFLQIRCAIKSGVFRPSLYDCYLVVLVSTCIVNTYVAPLFRLYL